MHSNKPSTSKMSQEELERHRLAPSSSKSFISKITQLQNLWTLRKPVEDPRNDPTTMESDILEYERLIQDGFVLLKMLQNEKFKQNLMEAIKILQRRVREIKENLPSYVGQKMPKLTEENTPLEDAQNIITRTTSLQLDWSKYPINICVISKDVLRFENYVKSEKKLLEKGNKALPELVKNNCSIVPLLKTAMEALQNHIDQITEILNLVTALKSQDIDNTNLMNNLSGGTDAATTTLSDANIGQHINDNTNLMNNLSGGTDAATTTLSNISIGQHIDNGNLMNNLSDGTDSVATTLSNISIGQHIDNGNLMNNLSDGTDSVATTLSNISIGQHIDNGNLMNNLSDGTDSVATTLSNISIGQHIDDNGNAGVSSQGDFEKIQYIHFRTPPEFSNLTPESISNVVKTTLKYNNYLQPMEKFLSSNKIIGRTENGNLGVILTGTEMNQKCLFINKNNYLLKLQQLYDVFAPLEVTPFLKLGQQVGFFFEDSFGETTIRMNHLYEKKKNRRNFSTENILAVIDLTDLPEVNFELIFKTFANYFLISACDISDKNGWNSCNNKAIAIAGRSNYAFIYAVQHLPLYKMIMNKTSINWENSNVNARKLSAMLPLHISLIYSGFKPDECFWCEDNFFIYPVDEKGKKISPEVKHRHPVERIERGDKEASGTYFPLINNLGKIVGAAEQKRNEIVNALVALTNTTSVCLLEEIISDVLQARINWDIRCNSTLKRAGSNFVQVGTKLQYPFVLPDKSYVYTPQEVNLLKTHFDIDNDLKSLEDFETMFKDKTKNLISKAYGDPEVNPDDDEQKYCVCKQNAYGEMIKCENDDCKIKVFHLECVGVEEYPQEECGFWYCPQCLLGVDGEELNNDEKDDHESAPPPSPNPQ